MPFIPENGDIANMDTFVMAAVAVPAAATTLPARVSANLKAPEVASAKAETADAPNLANPADAVKIPSPIFIMPPDAADAPEVNDPKAVALSVRSLEVDAAAEVAAAPTLSSEAAAGADAEAIPVICSEIEAIEVRISFKTPIEEAMPEKLIFPIAADWALISELTALNSLRTELSPTAENRNSVKKEEPGI